ncbi:hypothetical protein QPK24_23230 [Paenibacillus polygoni]|uniref:Tfp pilus assembly protein, major pilin PilA n=1 Tax=Paenibacillus polygoni TaxID=3050112 RepID=A0ABY8X1A1_9BACL|nr:hypothetical protein [Paenibacillus polygoni]WIV19190.1 hypothetical protein QPK24_23230 [Paenibacillus polygoni]
MRKQSKRSTGKVLIILLISVLFISACSSSNNANDTSGDDKEEKTFTSKDGQVELTVNKGWVEDPPLNEQAILAVSERKNEKYAIVNSLLKSNMADGATLDDFKAIFMSNIDLSITNAEESNNKTINVDSTEAQLFEITGEAQKVKVHYLVALLEKGGSFYQIITWSTQSKFEANKEELLQAIESFKVIKETPTTPASTSTSPPESTDPNNKDDQNTELTTLTSDDKKAEITIPATMSYEMELSPDADIQASRMQQEEYMMVLRESKDTFADNFTLTDYSTAVTDSMSQTLLNATLTDPKEMEVNGQPAVQYELSGEIDKIKISYLITLVETEGNFTQLLFWTLQNQMDEKRDMFINAASTFKEVQ